MPIMNKDGTVFRLQGPNPLLKEQSEWQDSEPVYLHNFSPEESKSKETSPKIPNPFIEIEQVQVQEEIIPQKEPEKPKTETPKPKKDVLVAWCLPAVIEVKDDPLYGPSTSISYGQKYSLEIVVRSRDDIGCVLWGQVNIDKGSILYLCEFREWWQVYESEATETGFNLKCLPSELTPSF